MNREKQKVSIIGDYRQLKNNLHCQPDFKEIIMKYDWILFDADETLFHFDAFK
ncbi:pyrimidine 5'-nucleotidase, partial [Vibrio cholerae]